jgi:alpha-1,4-fucosyltransferase
MKYFPIDSFGKCFQNMKGSKGPFTRSHIEFKQKLDVTSRYMFSMAMENGYTKDYVSEKVFQALLVGSIPIYQGAENILDFVPNHSIIQTSDFGSAEELSRHLIQITQNETLFDSYMAWKKEEFPKHFIDTYRHSLDNVHCFICQVTVDKKHKCHFDDF